MILSKNSAYQPRCSVFRSCLLLQLTGEGEGVFLFAELTSLWDQTNSEAIDKAISVLMNFFEWSLKDPKSSEAEYQALVSEIHGAKDARDITNLVKTLACEKVNSGNMIKKIGCSILVSGC